MNNCGHHGPHAVNRDASEHAEDCYACCRIVVAERDALREAAREAARALQPFANLPVEGEAVVTMASKRAVGAVKAAVRAHDASGVTIRRGRVLSARAALVRLAAVGVTPEER